MEGWSELVSSYPDDPDPKHQAKALRTAESLLIGDLAPFEIEWLVSTLLYKPVVVFNTILSNKGKEQWLKNIADAFKVISKIVTKHWSVIENESEYIVMLCMQQYDPLTKKEAINCLINVLKNPGVNIGNATCQVDALENAINCVAPLALLVGTICRYHPETVAQEYNRIWRIYLTRLQYTNITDTIANALLQGIDGLFENFGRDLDMIEVNNFYKDISRRFAKISRCIETLLCILRCHAGLFRERLAEDRVLREYLWNINSQNVKDALISIYKVIFEDAEKQKIQDIIQTEIQPRLDYEASIVKHTALRIAMHAKINYEVKITNLYRPDALEFQLRSGMISYQNADLVSLCLESREAYTKSLLATTIMYYENIPQTLRRGIVVKGILGATQDNRKVAINLLVELSRQDGCLQKYYDVWQGVLDPDAEVQIVQETVQHIASLLQAYLDEGSKDADQVLSLSHVLYFVLCVSGTEHTQLCEMLKPIIIGLSTALCISPTTLLSPKFVCVEMFENNHIIMELLNCLDNSTQVENLDGLSLIQVLFSKEVSDTKLLIQAVSKLDNLLKSGLNIDRRLINNMMKRIMKFKTKKDPLTSDNRVLLRNINLLEGEHGKFIQKENYLDDVCLLEMKNKLTINITNYEIDLLRMLQIALAWEDAEMLYCLLIVISTNLRDRPSSALRSIAWSCIHALLKCDRSIDVTPVLKMCATVECVRQVIDSIRSEVNPEVRSMLCDCLQVMLLHEPGSETAGQLLNLVAEQLLAMLSSHKQPIYDCGLDIARIFHTTLRQNDDLTLKYLPQIIILLCHSVSKAILKSMTDLFIEKNAIFEDIPVKDMIANIINNMKNNKNKTHLECIIEFLKAVIDVKNYDVGLIVGDIFDDLDFKFDVDEVGDVGVFANVLQILALSKPMFDEDMAKTIITRNDSVLVRKISTILSFNKDIEVISNVLKFLTEYADALIELHREQTIIYLCILIENIPQHAVSILKHDLSVCLSTYKSKTDISREIERSFRKWCEHLNIAELNESLNAKLSDLFPTSDENFADKIRSLATMCQIFDMAIENTENWTKMLLKNNDKLKFAVVSDLLSVSAKCLSLSEFDDILRNNDDFVRKYMRVYFERIVKSEINLDSGFFVYLLNYFVNNYKSYKHYHGQILELIEKNWPRFEEASFEDKLAIASDVLKLPEVKADLPPVLWVVNMITQESTSLDQKVKMITLLPGGEEYSGCYRHIAGFLPTRLTEGTCETWGVLRVLLDALATTGDMTLLDIIVVLAADDGPTWWSAALDACMVSLADRREERILDAVYSACKKRYGLGVCRRVLVPLLRHSPRAFCEQYISKIIQELISTLKMGYKEPSNTDVYRDRVLAYARAFAILQVVIEKLFTQSLESGILNENGGVREPWYLVKTVCICSVTLMDKVRCPDDASCEIRQACLRLQCAAYNCLTTAICRRRPAQKQYSFVFNTTAWSKIVDPDVEYEFKIRGYQNERSSRKLSDASTAAASTSFTGTVRTRIFMTTLSENPLQYDLIPNEDEAEDIEDNKAIGYANHPLNANGCLATLTMLLQHASTLEHTEWVTTVTEGLTSSLPLNAKWMIAQAICYAESDLKPHASALTPALLELVATTAKVVSDKHILNNLHIDILWTITKWNIPDLPSYIHLSSAVQHLISTSMEYRSQETVSRRLASTLDSLLQVYGTRVTVPWTVFQEYCDDLPENASHILTICHRILKNGISLPQLLPVLLTKFDAKLWPSTSKLPEVFGLALSLTMNENHLGKYCQVLDSLKSNVNGLVKVIMNAQKVCPRCCNERIFRSIVDLAPKAEKSKCLSIIAVYLENLEVDDGSCAEVFETIGLKELLEAGGSVEALKVVHGGFKLMETRMKDDIIECVSQECLNGTPTVRRQAYAVMMKVFQDIFQIKDQNTAKRPALPGTPILNHLDDPSKVRYHQLAVQRVAQGLFDVDQDISRMMRDGVAECLSKDMDKRLAEVFYLIFYFAKKDCLDLCEYGHVFLDLLFNEIKQLEGFRNKKFSDRPLPPSDIDIGYACTSGVRRQNQIYHVNEYRNIDVQMSVAAMFDVFLQAAKVNSQICAELCIQVIKKVAAEGSGPRFDLGSVMADILTTVLSNEPSCLTPLYLEVTKVFLTGVTGRRFKNALTGLQSYMRDDSLLYFNIVYEDCLLKDLDKRFYNFSDVEDLDVHMKYEDQQFSIENLTNVFGQLANWDDLRIQDKRRIEDSLPPVLVEGAEFESALDEYLKTTTLDYKSWFNKMAGAYNSYKLSLPLIQYKENWLKDAQRWPKRDFVTSAVIEAMQWPDNSTAKACEIATSDCLAEWAGRLMVRSAYYQDDSSQSVCRADELRWCSEATRRHLPTLALQCIERNKGSLTEDEALPWFHEKLEARRLLALKKDDESMLRSTLEAAVRQNDILSENDIYLQKVILQLQNDLQCITRTDLNAIFSNINKSNINNQNGGISSIDKDNLKCIYDIAMEFYSDEWDGKDDYYKENLLNNMINIIDQYLNYDLSKKHDLLISILINKLSYYEGTLSEEISKKILKKITILLPNLDSFTISHMKSILNIFPEGLRVQFLGLFGDEPLGLCKEYLRLICDPQYTLLQYCDKLLRTKDSTEWQKTYDKMKSTLFGSAYGGTDYISLNNIKNKLFAIENSDPEEKQNVLEGIVKELAAKPQRTGLRLSQLSPCLTRPTGSELQQDQLRRLLAIPPTVLIVKFKEQVEVYRDSIRRPCKISVLLSTGVTKSYIIKTGEPLVNDASLQRAVAVLPTLINRDVRSYNVTVLSEESAIIEYLEDHERLRDLMGDIVNIPLNRMTDDSLVQSPSLALEQFTAMRNKLPVYTLRSAIESRCISIQEFLSKKRVFLETLSTMTIASWLFGVGDRHLHNILWDKKDGGICSVDWATVFQYGAREFVPARLTDNLLAVCDVRVLEARLQNILENLRKRQKIYEAYIRISFYWKERDFKELTYIKGILSGTMTSYQITRDLMSDSNIRNRESCIKILDSVFENIEMKSTYSIEEQVSYLLRHCTDPQLLAVVPRGWEPWI